ncbi:MAG: prolipoprotein diacylglyceryl transferase [Bacteroidota bacterium]
MYPNLYYFFKDIFGVEWEWARFLNSFGFFVALSFLAAAYFLTRELKAREKKGYLKPIEETITVGKAATPAELIANALMGFVMGYKIIGAFMVAGEEGVNPQEYIFSTQGNWGVGISLAIFFAGIKWYEKYKQKMVKPEERKIRVWPHERVGDMTILAAVFGFGGAKIFHNLENWDDFVADPVGALLSFSGLTFYGGLICAAIAIIIYSKRKKISIRHLIDALAPALMIAYAIGRIGCQVSGDGDWGIPNSAYSVDENGQVYLADSIDFQKAVAHNPNYLWREFGTLNPDSIPHRSVKAPSFLPEGLFAYAYPHNVNSVGVPLAGCEGKEHCNYLPMPVFPTPFYETMICLLMFLILILIQNKLSLPGTLFSIYLIMNGLERFFIEKIRVNTKYQDLPFQPTQAEIISVGLILTAIFLLYFFKIQKGVSHKL